MSAHIFGVIEDARMLATGQRAAVVLTAVLAVAFGAFLVFGSGFAYSSTLHSVAHDARHALVFPCH